MELSRRFLLASFSASLSVVLCKQAAYAGTIISVSLWDKGPTSMDMMDTMPPLGMAVPGARMDMATMGITADIAEIPSGEVTFNVVNESQDFYHSLLIARVDDTANQLPYLIDTKMVDEKAVGRFAGVKELKPHASGSVTVDMKPGTYILYCNVAGHYMMGMWTLVTVD